MRILVNPRRISEVIRSQQVREAIDTFVTYRRPDVLKTLAMLWGVFLTMIFTLIVTVRLAFLVF